MPYEDEEERQERLREEARAAIDRKLDALEDSKLRELRKGTFLEDIHESRVKRLVDTVRALDGDAEAIQAYLLKENAEAPEAIRALILEFVRVYYK